ncbi:MAG: nuclease-related domain-containing protein [Proteobacteria bacterium]|nr:nuclease-related domain-containing protein [Pseudomonadota bacterium]
MPAIGIVPMIAGAIITNNHLRKRSICKTGIEGEDTLRTYLKNILSDEYTALYNVPVEHGDIDCLVIGPKGLYAIEVKNHRGIITYTNNTWRQIKRGRGGNSYIGKLNNPSMQLIQNIKWLKGYLGRYDIKPWINGLIVFTHPEVILSIDNLPILKAIKLEDLESAFLEKDTLSPMIQQSTETHLLQLMAA